MKNKAGSAIMNFWFTVGVRKINAVAGFKVQVSRRFY
jgi:hypothetical protein